jgi:SAM-dependent methyltransferase
MNSEPTHRSTLKDFVKGIPLVGPTAGRIAQLPIFARVRNLSFQGSGAFWESVYREGGTSGPGSYGRLARFKAEILNDFVQAKRIQSVIEFGCGDGAQLQLAKFPRYVGVDVATGSIQRCSTLFAQDPTKQFFLVDELPKAIGKFDLGLSLDVIYHLVENNVFGVYMRRLFDLSERYVIVYSSNLDAFTQAPHVRHRKFTSWIEKNAREWRQDGFVPNRFPFDPKRADPKETSHADFYFFTRKAS